MSQVIFEDKVDGDGTTANTRVSAADINNLKYATNSKEDAWIPTTITGAATSLALTHDHADFRFTHASPALTIPLQATVAFPANFKVSGRAASGVNIIAAAGVTLNGASGGSQAILPQNTGAYFELVRDAANVWTLKFPGTGSGSGTVDVPAEVASAWGGTGPGAIGFGDNNDRVKFSMIEVSPANIFDELSGQSGDSGTWGWISGIRTGEIVANVATLDWPTDTADHPGTTVYEATASFTLVLPTLGAELAATEPRLYRRTVYVCNIGIPSITITLAGAATGRIPLRGSNPANVFGEWIKIIIDYATPTGFAQVQTTQLGKMVPPFILKLLDSHTNNVQISSFNPHLYPGTPNTDPGDLFLLFMSRNTGTAAVLPTGKDLVFATGAGLTNGGVANGTANGSRLAISAIRAAEVDLGGTGSVTSHQHVSAIAYRGATAGAAAGLSGSSASVAYPSFTGLPEGAFVLYFTAVAQATQVTPAGGVNVHASDTAALGGWTWNTRRVDPVAGAVAPPPVAITSADWHTLAVVILPRT